MDRGDKTIALQKALESSFSKRDCTFKISFSYLLKGFLSGGMPLVEALINIEEAGKLRSGPTVTLSPLQSLELGLKIRQEHIQLLGGELKLQTEHNRPFAKLSNV